MRRALAQALTVIQKAESDIQSLMASAVEERAYEDLSQLARMAEQLSAIESTLDGSGGDSKTAADRSVVEQEASESVPVDESQGLSSKPSTTEFKKKAASKRGRKEASAGRKSRAKRSKYPCFKRDGDALVKIGYSQTKGSTYEHRSPKGAIDTIVTRVIQISNQDKRPFSAEALSGRGSHDGEGQILSYQLYLCLAWLKSLGLMRQHGRKGYSVVAPDSMEADVEKAWSDLA